MAVLALPQASALNSEVGRGRVCLGRVADTTTPQPPLLECEPEWGPGPCGRACGTSLTGFTAGWRTI